jgi:hypothetical protein
MAVMLLAECGGMDMTTWTVSSHGALRPRQRLQAPPENAILAIVRIEIAT